MTVSICMATHNGERYLAEQVGSILAQLGASDELVIVDDASKDGTVAYLESLRDPRIRIYRNERILGHVQSFAKAIGLARQPYIFMSDQDDVWISGRVQAMCDAMNSGADLVSTNSEFIDAEGRPIPSPHGGLIEADSDRNVLNILRIFNGRAYYYGCAMGLTRELRDIVLPIPRYVESHDLWIAMAANAARRNRHLEKNTLRRRVHGQNASIVSRSLARKLWSRIIFLVSMLHIAQRLRTRGSRLRPGR